MSFCISFPDPISQNKFSFNLPYWLLTFYIKKCFLQNIILLTRQEIIFNKIIWTQQGTTGLYETDQLIGLVDHLICDYYVRRHMKSIACKANEQWPIENKRYFLWFFRHSYSISHLPNYLPLLLHIQFPVPGYHN